MPRRSTLTAIDKCLAIVYLATVIDMLGVSLTIPVNVPYVRYLSLITVEGVRHCRMSRMSTRLRHSAKQHRDHEQHVCLPAEHAVLQTSRGRRRRQLWSALFALQRWHLHRYILDADLQ